MLLYSKILSVISFFNLLACSGLSIYYWIRPTDFAEGTRMNDLGFVVGFFAFFIMLILTAIYYGVLGEEKREALLSFNPLNITLYVVFSGNMIYRLLFDKQLLILGSATPAKIATTLALALVLNLTTITMAINYVRQNQRRRVQEKDA